LLSLLPLVIQQEVNEVMGIKFTFAGPKVHFNYFVLTFFPATSLPLSSNQLSQSALVI
jgi:hypothetical protein